MGAPSAALRAPNVCIQEFMAALSGKLQRVSGTLLPWPPRPPSALERPNSLSATHDDPRGRPGQCRGGLPAPQKCRVCVVAHDYSVVAHDYVLLEALAPFFRVK